MSTQQLCFAKEKEVQEAALPFPPKWELYNIELQHYSQFPVLTLPPVVAPRWSVAWSSGDQPNHQWSAGAERAAWVSSGSNAGP